MHYRRVSGVVLFSCAVVCFLLLSQNSTHFETTPLSFPAPIHYSNNKVIDLSKQSLYRNRIREVCDRIRAGYYMTGPTAEASVSQLRAMVDHYHQVVYCEISKVASGSWIMFFQSLFHREEAARKQWYSNLPQPLSKPQKSFHYKPYLELGVNKLSRGAEAHSETSEGMPDPREKYFKYMIVRHPLDRLGSAYTHMLDRYQYIKATKSSQQPKTVEPKKNFRNLTWLQEEDDKVRFEKFLKYIDKADVSLGGVDLHFLGYQSNCEPCDIDYDYIGHLEKIQEDLPFILEHFDALDLADSFPTNKLHKGRKAAYADLFSNASFSVLKPVLEKYRADADMFGYTFHEYVREADRQKISWLTQ